MTRGHRMASAYLCLAAVAAVPAAIGCSRDSGSAGHCQCPGAKPLVDPLLVAFLSKARAAHHVADQLEARGDVRGAASQLETLLGGPKPGYPQLPAEVKEVLSDTHARLADLLSRQSKFDAAEQHVRKGLKLSPDASYFRGHLFEVLGLVEERRSSALAARGERPLADKARQRAIDAFEQAINIQDAVIRTAIDTDAAQ